MATIRETKGYHDVSAKTWACSDCGEEFAYVGAPQCCPECGEEFNHIDMTTITSGEVKADGN